MAAATAGTKAQRPAARPTRSDRRDSRDRRVKGAAPSRSRTSPSRADQTRRPSRPRRAAGVRPWVAVLGGVVWAALLVIGVGIGAPAVDVVLVPVGLVACAAGVRSVKGTRGAKSRRGQARPSVVGLLLTLVVPLAALAGEAVAVAGLVLTVGIAVISAASLAAVTAARPVRATAPLAFAMAAPAVAVTSLVLARLQDPTDALVLVAALLVYDASAFVMGNGRSALGGPAAVVSGALSVAVVAVVVAATMDPPFSGVRPWAAFSLVAMAAPMGVWLGDLAFGRTNRLPAFRRLDSLVLAGPVWVVVSAAVLHR